MKAPLVSRKKWEKEKLRVAALQQLLDSAEETIGLKETELDRARTEISQKNARIEELSWTVAQGSAEIASLKSTMRTLEQRLASAREDAQKKGARIEELEDLLERRTKQRDEARSHCSAAQKKLAQLRRLHKTQKRLEREIRGLTFKRARLEEVNAALREEQGSILKAVGEALSVRSNEVAQQLALRRTELEQLTQKVGNLEGLAGLERAIAAASDRLRLLETEERGRRGRLEVLLAESALAEKKLGDIRLRASAAEASLTRLLSQLSGDDLSQKEIDAEVAAEQVSDGGDPIATDLHEIMSGGRVGSASDADDPEQDVPD